MRASALLLSATAAMPLAAQVGYESSYEALAGSATGTPLAGREGYTVPTTTPASSDAAIFTYAGNALGLPVQPFGQQVFLALAAGTDPAQVERLLNVPPDCQWHIEFDIAVIYRGTTAPTGAIGAFSLQPDPTAASATLLARWPAGTTFPPTTWDADVVLGPGAGTATSMPDARWHSLAVGLWHRWGCSVSLARGEYTLFSLDNGATGVRSLFLPPAGSLPIVHAGNAVPTSFRLSALGPDCVLAIDRISIAVHADYAPFGNGCPGALGIPSLSSFGAPQMSTTFTARLVGLPSNLALLAMGFSDANSIAGPLPLPLDTFGMPGCSLFAEPAATLLIAGVAGIAQWNVQVPNGPQFMGLHFYNQGFSFDASANAAGLAASNAARACIGR